MYRFIPKPLLLVSTVLKADSQKFHHQFFLPFQVMLSLHQSWCEFLQAILDRKESLQLKGAIDIGVKLNMRYPEPL